MRRFFWIGFVLAVLSLVGFVAGPALASGCYSGSYGYSYGNSPNYNYSYYSPPSYPVYYPVVQKEYYPVYHEREVQVPYAKPVYVNKDYYYSLRDYYEDKKRDDTVAEAAAYKALLLGAQLQQAQQGQMQSYRQSYGYQVQPGAALLQAPVAGGYGQSAYQQPAYAPPQQPAYQQPAQPAYQQPAYQQPALPTYSPPSPPQAPPAQPSQQPAQPPPAPAPAPDTRPRPKGTVQITDVNPKLQAVVKNQCIRCHHGQEERMDLTELGTLNVGERGYMESLVRSGIMPKGGDPLSNEDTKLFEEHTAKAHKALVAKH